MNNLSPTEIFLFGLGILLIVLVLYIFLTRYVHEIRHRKQNECAQTRLLEEIARKLGVEESTINTIIYASGRL